MPPPPTSDWSILRGSAGHVSVVPNDDLVEHVVGIRNPGSTVCVCGPTTTPVFRPDGSNGWVITHHSLDGRELHETPPQH